MNNPFGRGGTPMSKYLAGWAVLALTALVATVPAQAQSRRDRADVEVDSGVLDRLGGAPNLPDLLGGSAAAPAPSGAVRLVPPGQRVHLVPPKTVAPKTVELKPPAIHKPTVHKPPVHKPPVHKPPVQQAKTQDWVNPPPPKPAAQPQQAAVPEPPPVPPAKTEPVTPNAVKVEPPHPADLPKIDLPPAATTPPAPPKVEPPPAATAPVIRSPALESAPAPIAAAPVAPVAVAPVAPPPKPAQPAPPALAEIKAPPAPPTAPPTASPPAPPVAEAKPTTLASLPSAPPADAKPAASSPPAVAPALTVGFGGDDARLADKAKPPLQDLALQMDKDQALHLTLLAYAAGDESQASKARRLSLSRALAVRSFLMDQGVRSTRIEVRALGNKVADSPADRVDLVVEKR